MNVVIYAYHYYGSRAETLALTRFHRSAVGCIRDDMNHLRCLPIVALLPLLGCSPSGVREWAAAVQLQAATGLDQQQAEHEPNAWQRAGASGGTRNPRAEAEAAAAAEAAAKPTEPASSPPTISAPRYIYVAPTR